MKGGGALLPELRAGFTLYMRLRDELGVIYEDEAFTPLFSERRQPAEAPWRLALVTIMQYVEGLSDRQAAEAVRSRIDWVSGPRHVKTYCKTTILFSA